jgi:hypothetical protein
VIGTRDRWCAKRDENSVTRNHLLQSHPGHAATAAVVWLTSWVARCFAASSGTTRMYWGRLPHAADAGIPALVVAPCSTFFASEMTMGGGESPRRALLERVAS